MKNNGLTIVDTEKTEKNIETEVLHAIPVSESGYRNCMQDFGVWTGLRRTGTGGWFFQGWFGFISSIFASRSRVDW